jgi:hypothetical protein
VRKLNEILVNVCVYTCFLILLFFFLGFSYEFNSLTSPNELADAYDILVSNQTTLRFTISKLANYFPFIRNIPIDINNKFKSACAVIDRESGNLVKRKNKEAEFGELKGNDLLSVLININKKLPIEERLTDEELKNQVTKSNV